jgi:hypothetical protein
VPTTRPSGSDDPAEQVALFRYRVIAEPANPRLSPAERGRLVRALAATTHLAPDGAMRTVSRGTLDRWIVDYQARTRPTAWTGCAPSSAPTPAWCAATPSCWPRRPRCVPSARPARRPTSPRSSTTATASRSASAPCAPTFAARGSAGPRWRPSPPGCSAATRPNGQTSAGSATCSRDRSCPTLGWPAASAPSCLCWSTTTRACWCTAAGWPRRTPAPARTCSGRRSCAAGCPRSSTSTTVRPTPTPRWTAAAPCLASGSSTASRIGPRAAASRSGSTEAQPGHPGAVPARGRGRRDRLAGGAGRPLGCLDRAGAQLPGPRRDRPDPDRPVPGRRATPCRRPRARGPGVSLVSDPHERSA